MLKLNDLRPAPGAHKKAKRVGRGQGSGKGSTSGYGNNGDKSRSGARTKPYFEGGQTPLTRRIPKRGFTNAFRVDYQIVNVDAIEKAGGGVEEIDARWLCDKGLVWSSKKPVKILGGGELTRKIVVKANGFSKSAREKIEKMKGKAEVIAHA